MEKNETRRQRKFPSFFAKVFLGKVIFPIFTKNRLVSPSMKSPIFQKISQKFVKGKTKGERFSDLFVNGKKEKLEKFSSLLSAAFSFARL
jgi:hypothetical protein